MANLYEIDAAILNCVDRETGEIINEEALQKLQIERNRKIEGIALWIKNLRADVEAYKVEKKEFEQKIASAENKMERLKTYLGSYLAGEKFKTSKVTISYINSDAVIIDDLVKLDDDYLNHKAPEPNKTKIKKSLKEGIVLEGVHLEYRSNMQIR